MQEMNDEELEAVEGGATERIKLVDDLSKYYFYPTDSVTKNGTSLKATSQTSAKRKKLSTVIKGQKVIRLNEKDYSFTQNGKHHIMMYVKLSPSNLKGYINMNADGGYVDLDKFI